jgi:hypothetical protein
MNSTPVKSTETSESSRKPKKALKEVNKTVPGRNGQFFQNNLENVDPKEIRIKELVSFQILN